MSIFERWLNGLDSTKRNYIIGKLFCQQHFGCDGCPLREKCDNPGFDYGFHLSYVEIGSIVLANDKEVNENGCQENEQEASN